MVCGDRADRLSLGTREQGAKPDIMSDFDGGTDDRIHGFTGLIRSGPKLEEDEGHCQGNHPEEDANGNDPTQTKVLVEEIVVERAAILLLEVQHSENGDDERSQSSGVVPHIRLLQGENPLDG